MKSEIREEAEKELRDTMNKVNTTIRLLHTLTTLGLKESWNFFMQHKADSYAEVQRYVTRVTKCRTADELLKALMTT